MKSKRHASDISVEHLAGIEPVLRSVSRITRPRQMARYEVFFSVLYLLRG